MNCILCGSSDLSLRRRIYTDDLIQRWKIEFDIDISANMDRRVELSKYQCNNCLLSFFSPSFPASSDVYRQLEKFDWYYLPDKWEYYRTLQDLKDYSPAIEIGSGEGHFIALARDILDLEITGIEINPDAVRLAKAKNRPVEMQALDDLAARSPGTYKAVCSFQVLEHIDSPRAFLQACCDLLMPGGKLILAVPNGAGFHAKMDLITDMPPHHMTVWQPETLRSIVTLFPLECIGFSFEPLQTYHASLWLQSLLPGWQVSRFITRRMSKFVQFYLRVVPHQQILKGMNMVAVFKKG